MTNSSTFRTNIFLAFLGLATITLVIWSTAYGARKKLFAEMSEDASNQLIVYGANLEAELAKYRPLPRVLAAFPSFSEFLLNQENVELKTLVNQKLNSINNKINALATYLINKDGITIAASNHSLPSSFIGEDLNFRPYFRNALKHGSADYFALGTTSKKRGHYYAATITNNTRVLGVIVIKVQMDHLEEAWENSAEKIAVTDEDGIIFITTKPEWLFRSFAPIPEQRLIDIRKSLRYGDASLSKLNLTDGTLDADGEPVLTLDEDKSNELLVQSLPIASENWQVHIFSRTSDIRDDIIAIIKSTGSISLLSLGLLAWLRSYRNARIRQAKIESDTKQRVNDRLEILVKERTQELSVANYQLTDEIAERKETERALLETQEQLVQAAKMAALGQMATSINHELNQPLGAIRTFADTAQSYLKLENREQVESNLGLIAKMADRMADIMTHLKAFARKTPFKLMPVQVDHAIKETLLVMRPATESSGATIEYSTDSQELHVVAEPVRLQQIITNLIQNALDSVNDSEKKQIAISVKKHNSRVKISVQDTGTGISSEIRKKLFEPFYSTKSVGDGLGLGLSITYGLVESFNGTIEVSNNPDGGATFTLTLMLTNSTERLSA